MRKRAVRLFVHVCVPAELSATTLCQLSSCAEWGKEMDRCVFLCVCLAGRPSSCKVSMCLRTCHVTLFQSCLVVCSLCQGGGPLLGYVHLSGNYLDTSP